MTITTSPPPAGTPTPSVSPSRTRPMAVLFTGAALMNAAMAVAGAAATLLAADRLGPAWGAVPNTAAVLGTGIGALLLTRVMHRGRAAGLRLGYGAAAVGGALAAVAAAAGDVLGLTIGMALLGLGNAGAQLSRYAAAELYPPHRRGFAISTVTWAGAVGAVAGPLLLAPAGRLAVGLGWAALAGPFLIVAAACGLALVVSAGARGRVAEIGRSRMPVRGLLAAGPARSALAVMVTAQVVMAAVMTAAPLDLHLHGHGLASVGVALSVHTLGMFALSPLTGWVLDRAGARPVMLAGLLTLAASTVLVAAGSGHAVPRTAGLFLLGYGWNLCLVGGSGRLARDLPAAERAQVEGAVDGAVWGVAAAASLASTAVLSSGGYGVLAGAAGALVLLPALLLRAERQRS